jgi:hypothetical protein
VPRFGDMMLVCSPLGSGPARLPVPHNLSLSLLALEAVARDFKASTLHHSQLCLQAAYTHCVCYLFARPVGASQNYGVLTKLSRWLMWPRSHQNDGKPRFPIAFVEREAVMPVYWAAIDIKR